MEDTFYIMYSDEGPNKEGQKIDVLLTQTAEGLLAQLARRTMDVARKAHDNPFRDTGFRNVEPDDSTYEGRWKFQFINRQQRLEGEVMTIDENGFAIMRDVLGRRRNVSGFNHNSMRSARVWHTHQKAHKEHEIQKEVAVEKSQPLSDPVAVTRKYKQHGKLPHCYDLLLADGDTVSINTAKDRAKYKDWIDEFNNHSPKDGRVKRTLSEKKAVEEVDKDTGKGVFTKTAFGKTSTNKEESTKTHAKTSENGGSTKTNTLESDSNTKNPGKKSSDKSPSSEQSKK